MPPRCSSIFKFIKHRHYDFFFFNIYEYWVLCMLVGSGTYVQGDQKWYTVMCLQGGLRLLTLKNTTASYFTSQRGLLKNGKGIAVLDHERYAQTTGRSGEQRRAGFICWKKPESGEGLLCTQVHWRKVRVKNADSSSLAELWQFLIDWAVARQGENLPSLPW